MAGDVYVLSTTNIFGGGEIFQIELASLMRGHLRLVVISPPLPALESGLAEWGAGFAAMPARDGWALRWTMLRWLWRQREAIRLGNSPVVLNGRGAAYLAPFVRLLSGAAPVIVFHTGLSMRPFDLKEALYGMAATFARCVVAVSDTVASQHRQRWPRLVVQSIPNWIDVGERATVDRGHPFPPTGEVLPVAVVARLAPGKGVEDVLVACRDEDGIELHVYGDGPMRDRLHDLARRLPRAYFHGHVNDLSQRLPAHSVLLSGSHSESFSYTVAEGIKAGLLCVVTDIPAHRELLGADYPNELFFPPGDIAGLKRALRAARALLANEKGEGARQAVRAARTRIATRNAPELARQRYLAVFSAASAGA